MAGESVTVRREKNCRQSLKIAFLKIEDHLLVEPRLETADFHDQPEFRIGSV
jgi:hypothetical protein